MNTYEVSAIGDKVQENDGEGGGDKALIERVGTISRELNKSMVASITLCEKMVVFGDVSGKTSMNIGDETKRERLAMIQFVTSREESEEKNVFTAAVLDINAESSDVGLFIVAMGLTDSTRLCVLVDEMSGQGLCGGKRRRRLETRMLGQRVCDTCGVRRGGREVEIRNVSGGTRDGGAV